MRFRYRFRFRFRFRNGIMASRICGTPGRNRQFPHLVIVLRPYIYDLDHILPFEYSITSIRHRGRFRRVRPARPWIGEAWPDRK
ncbi:MAG: hypothetical protein CVU59_02735 [Deltaproteobacteria bacterium HGW-Deltaproteobacteria-17]|nr:MAG: hypothetical protein CVU59_02735 [Deltaproteobacteria bacterium HGW-Deltaproteobacteria-17]